MKCSPSDLRFLFVAFPFLKVAHRNTTKQLLDFQIQEGSELCYLLKKYPEVLYERLDFFYICLKALSILDVDVIDDLSSCYGWQGVVIASWFSALNPAKDFYEPLKKSRLLTPTYNQWIIDLALSEIEKSAFEPDLELQSRLREFRRLLNIAKYQSSTVRKFYPSTILEQEKALTEDLRSIFRKYGVDAANEYLQKSPLFGLLLP